MVTIDVTPGTQGTPALDDLTKRELWEQVRHQAHWPPAYSTLCRWLDRAHMNWPDPPYSHKHVYVLVQLANHMHNARGKRLKSFEAAKVLAIAAGRAMYGKKTENPKENESDDR